MSDVARLAASQHLLDGRFVLGGITTFEGFDGCGPSAFGARLSARGPCVSLSGEVQNNAGALCTVGSRVGSGSLCERSLYGEMFGCIVYNKRGGSVGEGAPILAHHGSPAGVDRVVGPLRISKLMEE